MSNNQNMIQEQQNQSNNQDSDGKHSEIDKSQSDGSDNTSIYSNPEPKLKEIKPQFVRGIQRIKQMWRIYLDSEVDRMLLLTEGITLRNKLLPLHSQNQYYQKDEYITTTVRVKNIPLSAGDGQIDREFRQRNIEVFTINRERLRVDNLVTNCWTGDRVVICKKFDKPLPRFLTIGQYTARIYHFGQMKDTDMFLCNKCELKGHNIYNCQNEWKCRLCNEYGHKMFDCPTFLAKKMGKNSETERDEQQEATTANVDENTDTEERQQIQALTENDKKDDTDEQPELTDGDDEDNLTHSMSLNKEITEQKKKEKKKAKKSAKRKETKLQVILLNNRHQNRQKQKEILHQHNLTFQNF
ncbi:unnamed protein product [Mytilus coruscus]|uniref:CCHC-type domain-containing protein n=1 Tax=Mytilus coruscus TaxID=42192 RepID=A0A6J8C2I9_MYTCO|nr:unnamed protein product [Mytilus coruscus]